MPKDILRKCRSPKELCEYFGNTSFRLIPKVVRNDDEMENNKSIMKKGVPLYMYLPIFVMNRIPSDLFRIRN